MFALFYLFAFAGAVHAQSKNYVEGELIVKYKSNTTATFQKHAIEKFGFSRVKRIGVKGLSHIRIPKNKKLESALNELRQDPDVEYAQPNYIYKTSVTPNDPYYSREWGLKNTGQTIGHSLLGGPDEVSSSFNPGTSGSDMKLEAAWGLITDCSSVTVAVLDTGINYNHNDLVSNMWNGGVTYPKHGYDFVDNTNDPMDKNGHGTHVAATIGAVGNNSTGTTGVCWKVGLMAVRVMDATGSGTTASIIQGIDFAVANGAKIINMSLGGPSLDAAESTAITNAESNGVLVVVAAGNSNENVDNVSTPTYPCKFTQANLLCVAALAQNYSLATFSNYGSVSVDVGAPGVNIVSAWPGTHSTYSDTLSSGWNFASSTNSGWGYKSLNFGVPTNTLANPGTYDYSSAKYLNSTDDRTWKSFDLSTGSTAILKYSLMIDSELNKDFVDLKISTTAGDPIPAGTLIEQVSGPSGGSRVSRSLDISTYKSANTTIGFNFTSDGTGNDFGANLSLFSIEILNLNNTTYNVISGTSMATPHVAGLAAMIFAYNPDYTYTDVIASIKGGGDTLSILGSKTTSSKAVNATNSLAHIIAPTGGAAVKLP